jgi:hypothetical protein
MGLLTRLRQTGEIPASTNPNTVLQLENHLFHLLGRHLGRTYLWLATCTVAVEAGRYGGERRRRQRLRLAAEINSCRAFRGLAPLALPAHWEREGLFYGYGAAGEYALYHQKDPMEVMLLGWLLSYYSKKLKEEAAA